MLLQASITNLLTASSRLFRCLLDALDAESSQVLTPSLKVGQSLKFSIGYQFYCVFSHWLTFSFLQSCRSWNISIFLLSSSRIRFWFIATTIGHLMRNLQDRGSHQGSGTRNFERISLLLLIWSFRGICICNKTR